MTDNNWITPEWINIKAHDWEYNKKYQSNACTFHSYLSAEINKEIKNILESAEKRDCKTCFYENDTLHLGCVDCTDCIPYPNWTPKEVK